MYAPVTGRFLSMDFPFADGTEILGDSPFVYAQNNPVNRISLSGIGSISVNGAVLNQAPPAAKGCSPAELQCIEKAKKLALDILRKTKSSCFESVLQNCRSNCTSAELANCAIAALERARIVCEPPDPRHPRSGGRTEGLCAAFKDWAARGEFPLPPVNTPHLPTPCISPIPNASNCSLCIGSFPIDLILYRYGRGRPTIDKYCPDKTRELANIMVHEAMHNCVGGHVTTNPSGSPNSVERPTCDVCCRPDTSAIEDAFSRCN